MIDRVLCQHAPLFEARYRLLVACLEALAALLLAICWASPASAIVTATENPSLTKGKITIGLREELGENAEEIERILLENPRVRIGWPSEYEVSADPEWPDNFYLIDMNFRAASSTYRQWHQGPDAGNSEAAAPIFVGRLDDASFAEGLESELRKIQRQKALLGLNIMPAFRHGAYINVRYAPDSQYLETENSMRLRVRTPLSLEINVFDGNDQPQFVYVLMTRPDNEIEWVFVTGSDHPINPGDRIAINFGESGFQFDQAGRYEFLTISSNSPIKEGLFASGIAEQIDRSSCTSLLEKILCEVITDVRDPDLPREIDANSISDWSTSFNRYYGDEDATAMVGGGTIAPAGFAPWQVQIYSTVTYTRAQIEADSRLGSRGKYLKDQEPFQLYHRCAGTLISTNTVLTAAHCVAKAPVLGKKVLKAREVLVGTQDLERGGAKYRIVSVITHAGYRPGNPKDDIALVRITPKSRKLPPKTILLPGDVNGFRPTLPRDRVQLLGWGYTGMVERGQRTEVLAPGRPQLTEAKLRMAEMEILDPEKCRQREGYGNVVVKKLCAETPKSFGGDKATFSCTRDSGGPVIRWQGSKKVQVGIIVWGVGCGASEDGEQNPSLFVDVAQYSEWIERAKQRISKLEWDVERLP
jgi:secreted trypsin-like serine protease